MWYSARDFGLLLQPFIALSTYPDLLHLCRFFLGKTKVSQVALGRSDAEEYREGLYLLSKVNEGNSAAPH